MEAAINTIISYACWAPAAWQDHPFPHLLKDDDMLEQARSLILLYDLMGWDTICLSVFEPIPGSNSPHVGEWERAREFLDILADMRTKGQTTLTAFILYEGLAARNWEGSAAVAARLDRMSKAFDWDNHPAYTRDEIGRPLTVFWRAQHRLHEAVIRDAKQTYCDTHPQGLKVYARQRLRWFSEAQPIDDALPITKRIDRRMGYPEKQYVDGGAMPHAVAWNTASVNANTQEWILQPNIAAFAEAISKPLPAGVDIWGRDGEENEAGNQLVAVEWQQYIAVVRDVLV